MIVSLNTNVEVTLFLERLFFLTHSSASVTVDLTARCYIITGECWVGGNIHPPIISRKEVAVTTNFTHPLKDFVDCVLFTLHSCFAKLLGVQTFRSQFQFQFAILSVQVENAIA